jgi:hypothetical protein
MFSFSLGQGLVEHIFVISHGIMVENYVKRKKEVMLNEKMGKVAKGKKRKKNKNKRKRKRKGKKERKSVPLCS